MSGSIGRDDVRRALVIIAAIAACLALSWVGFIASDDAFYFRGADLVLHNPMFAGDDHWTTRFPVTWSFAAVIALVGNGFHAFAAMSLLWFLALVTLIGIFTAAVSGRRAGWCAVLLAGTTSVIVTNASIVNCDVPEAFFLLLGVYVIMVGRTRRTAYLGGLAWGAAILSRETAILALAGLVPLFIIGRPVERKRLMIAAAGIASVLILEGIFQYLATGTPLRRYILAINHDPTMDRARGNEGNLVVNPWLDPLLALLFNNEFGLLFWVLAVALWAHLRTTQPPAILMLGALGFANIVLVSLLSTKLVLNPRYFTIAAVAAIVFIAAWASTQSRRVRWTVLGTMTLVSMLLLSLQNAHPRWDVEMLPVIAQQHSDDTILAPSLLVRRAELPLRFARLGNVVSGMPIPGALYFGPRPAAPDAMIIDYRPAPPRPLVQILSAAGLFVRLPQAIRSRLSGTGEPAMLWRIKPLSEGAGAPAVRQSVRH